jgi:hypothetical protein
MYIDPAAGSLVLQAFAAGVLAVAASVRSTREAVKNFFQRLLGRGRKQ